METIKTCSQCKSITFLFTYFFSLCFDLNYPELIKKGKKEIDLIELFKMQNNISLDLKGLKKRNGTQRIKKIFYVSSLISIRI